MALNLVSVLPPSRAATLRRIGARSIKDELHGPRFVLDYRRGDISVVDRVCWDGKRIGRVLTSIESVSDENRPWGVAASRPLHAAHRRALRLLQRGEVTMRLCTSARRVNCWRRRGRTRPYGLDGIKPLLGCCATGCRLRRRNSFSSRPGRDCRTIRYCYSRAVFAGATRDRRCLAEYHHLPDLKPTPPKTDTIRSDSMVRLTREDVDDIKRRRVDHLKMAAAWLRESLEADASNWRPSSSRSSAVAAKPE